METLRKSLVPQASLTFHSVKLKLWNLGGRNLRRTSAIPHNTVVLLVTVWSEIIIVFSFWMHTGL